MLEDDSWMTLEQLEARGEQRYQAHRKREMYWRQFGVGERTLDTRTINCLSSSDIETIEELAQKTEVELLELPNVGRKTIHDIKTFLEFKGLTIKAPPARRLDAQPWYKFCL